MKVIWKVLCVAVLFAVSADLAEGQSLQPIPGSVKKILAERYVRMESAGVKKEQGKPRQLTADVKENGTGVRIGGNCVLAPFHLLQNGYAFGANGIPAKYVAMAPEYDLIVVQEPFDTSVPAVTLAPAEPGNVVVGLSNADASDGFLVEHLVSKVKPQWTYFENPVIPGESGTGYFDFHGRLIGLGDENEASDNGEGMTIYYGAAISASTIKTFFDEHAAELKSAGCFD